MSLHPPPYRVELAAPYEKVWRSLIQALASENTPLRTVAKDSGVIASDDLVTPIGVYADCGRFGDTGVEGEALVAFTLFVQPQNPETTQLQVNSKMSSASFRTSWWQRHPPMLQCASTGRWESNLFDAVRRLLEEQRE
jgi:hypothetical protein